MVTPAADSNTTRKRRTPTENARPKRQTDTSTAPVHAESTVVAQPAPPSAPAPATPVQTPTPAVVPPPEPPPSADTSRVVLRDGVYSGWGTSRHGDIQASVEVKDGRIVSATITQCLTRYSCSWIADLPGQVVKRQSPEVDLVSGATQSTDAFYSAVVEALSKAK